VVRFIYSEQQFVRISPDVAKKMKLLITADLHLNIPARNRRTGQFVIEAFKAGVNEHNPDGIVIAGDIGIPEHSHRHLVEIREAIGDRLFAITLGNHDFWLDSTGHGKFTGLSQVIRRYWREPARDVGAILLDLENADLGDVVLAGCYGHYDLGLAVPDLVIEGRKVTKAMYLSGGINGLFWNDFRNIPNCAPRLFDEAAEQAEELASRMDAAIARGRRLVAVTHTCPWKELNGHPMGRGSLDIFAAYSGNSLVGQVLSARAHSIDFHCCGHTHMPVELQEILGIRCLNIGADYGVFRAVIYDTVSRGVLRIGEKVGDLAAEASHGLHK
jgi:predicted phosphodiesterase